MRLYFGIIIALISAQVVGSTHLDNEFLADVHSYCQYIAEKNNSKRRLLTSPDVIVRVQNSDNELLSQNNLIAAFSKDLVDFRKAKFVRQLIDEECQFYKLNEEAKLHVAFAIPNAQRQALLFKLKHIHSAKAKIKQMLKGIQNKIDKQDDTVNSYYRVDSLLQKLEDAQQDILINLAMQQPPKLQPVKLSILLRQVWDAQRKRQETLNKLDKQYNWAVQVQAGAQQYLAYDQNLNNNPILNQSQNKKVQPYVGLFMRYNLGSISSNHKVDKSLGHFMDWKNKQVSGVQSRLAHLNDSVTKLERAQQQRLIQLKQYYQKYYGLNKKMEGIDSLKALHFKQQVEVDRIMMEIEIKYVTCLIDLLGKIV